MKPRKSIKFLTTLFITSLLLIVSISVIFTTDSFPQTEASSSSPPLSDIQAYLIGPEDVLEISVWKNADLSRTVVVRPDGMISLPLIGDIRAAGRTPEQLRDEIVNRLKEYQETVVASVIVQTVNSYKVFIVGEVKAPGEYSLKRKTSILQAIAMAGGFTQFAAKNSIVIVREKGGSEERIKVRFDDIVKGKGNNTNLILKPGDTIVVPTKTIF